MRETSEKGLFRTTWDSAFDFISQPRLGDRLWEEGRVVKKHRVLLIVVIITAITLVHFCDPWPRTPRPYTGETKLRLFFNGEGAEPKLVSKVNIYRAYTMVVNMQFTSPKDEKLVNIATGRVWVVGIIFDREIEAVKMVLSADGLGQDTIIDIRDFTGRSATVIVEPKQLFNPNDPNNPINPKGLLEIRAEKRTSNSN